MLIIELLVELLVALVTGDWMPMFSSGPYLCFHRNRETGQIETYWGRS
jgi:hypothetical protein